MEVELELGAGVVLRVRRTAPCGAVFRRVESGCAPSLPTCGARGPLRSACRFAGRRNTAAEDADGVRDPKQRRSRHRDEHGDRTREHSDEQQDSLHGFKFPARWHDSADERARHTQGSARRAETTNYCVWRRTRTVPSQPLRNVYEPAMRAALPVPHSSSLDFTAERTQTKGRSREIHWFGVDGGTCGPDFTDAVRPDRRQSSRLRRRSEVDDVVDPNSLRDDRGAWVARRRGARTARCFPRCFRRTRRVRLRRRSRSGSASRRRARCPIRHSYCPSCCLCEHRRLLGPCHVRDSLPRCRCAERRA